jgi:hypothetical protein
MRIVLCHRCGGQERREGGREGRENKREREREALQPSRQRVLVSFYLFAAYSVSDSRYVLP